MTVLQLWSLHVVLLFLLQFVLACVQGAVRVKTRAFVRPEDARWFRVQPATAESPLVANAQRAILNNHENVPFFLALSLAYTLLECWPMGASIYFPIFVAARICHNCCQLWPRQPLRNRCYLIGVITLLCMSVHVVMQIVSAGER